MRSSDFQSRFPHSGARGLLVPACNGLEASGRTRLSFDASPQIHRDNKGPDCLKPSLGVDLVEMETHMDLGDPV